MVCHLFAAYAFYGGVGVAEFFCTEIYFVREVGVCKRFFKVCKDFELGEEPFVYFGYIVNNIYSDATLYCLKNHKQSLVVAGVQTGFDFVIGEFGNFGVVKAVEFKLCATHRLHKRFLKRCADAHYFARRFHLSAELFACVHKFIKRPFGELYNNVVECRLKCGIGYAGYVIFNLVKVVADCNFCCNLCYGITRCLGGKGGRA